MEKFSGDSKKLAIWWSYAPIGALIAGASVYLFARARAIYASRSIPMGSVETPPLNRFDRLTALEPLAE